jgi:predicted DNA-binding transcriptional regulator AlpA
VSPKPKSFHIDKRAAALSAAVAAGDGDEMLAPKKVAALTGYSQVWLAKRRADGTGPPFVKVNRRSVRYRRSKLVAWVKEREHKSIAAHEAFLRREAAKRNKRNRQAAARRVEVLA